MQVVSVEPAVPFDGDGVHLSLDPEWLVVLRATHHIASSVRLRPRVPKEDMVIEAEDMAWIERCLQEKGGSKHLP